MKSELLLVWDLIVEKKNAIKAKTLELFQLFLISRYFHCWICRLVLSVHIDKCEEQSSNYEKQRMKKNKSAIGKYETISILSDFIECQHMQQLREGNKILWILFINHSKINELRFSVQYISFDYVWKIFLSLTTIRHCTLQDSRIRRQIWILRCRVVSYCFSWESSSSSSSSSPSSLSIALVNGMI